MPRDPMPLLQHKECAIEPGCSYNVELKTSTTRHNFTYTVPGICALV